MGAVASVGIEILPLIAGHIALPPLSYVARSELPPVQVLKDIYEMLPNGVESWKWMANNMFLCNEWVQETPLCWISHIFIHGDYSHMIGNVISLLFAAAGARQNASLEWVYFVFFAGGMASVIPSVVRL
jgi:membrane associated rhomboid family serine protease